MEIVSQKNNPLLHREEIIVKIESDVIPSKIEITKQIAELTKKTEENVVIGRVDSKFGNKTFEVDAKIYDNTESRDKYETIPRKVKKKLAADEKKAAEEKAKAEEESKKAAVNDNKSETTEVKSEEKVESPAEQVNNEAKTE